MKLGLGLRLNKEQLKISAPDAFISVWKTDNTGTSNDDQVKLPLVSTGTYDFYIDWGDDSEIDHITAYNQDHLDKKNHTILSPVDSQLYAFYKT